MVDYKTWKRIHGDTGSKSSLLSPGSRLGVPMSSEIFDKEEPPGSPDLLLLPSKVVGFELRTKKWSKLNSSCKLG